MKKPQQETKRKPFIGEETPEAITAWKAANPDGIYAFAIDGKIIYMKHPSFEEIDEYHTTSEGSENITDAWKNLLENCFLGGCADLKDSVKYVPTIHALMKNKIVRMDVELVNL
jgi:hypothetical protein